MYVFYFQAVISFAFSGSRRPRDARIEFQDTDLEKLCPSKSAESQMANTLRTIGTMIGTAGTIGRITKCVSY